MKFWLKFWWNPTYLFFLSFVLLMWYLFSWPNSWSQIFTPIILLYFVFEYSFCARYCVLVIHSQRYLGDRERIQKEDSWSFPHFIWGSPFNSFTFSSTKMKRIFPIIFEYYYGGMFVFPFKFICWNPTNVMVLFQEVIKTRASLVDQMVRNLPTDQGSIPGSGRSPGEGNGYPFQSSDKTWSMGE